MKLLLALRLFFARLPSMFSLIYGPVRYSENKVVGFKLIRSWRRATAVSLIKDIFVSSLYELCLLKSTSVCI